MSSRCLLLVHAHPDDEVLGTGGTIARYAAEGAHVCLVTCTNGELGEVAEVPELGDAAQVRSRLAEVRIAELEEACRRLGDVDLRVLGFHDSGMAGTPSNDDPRAFTNTDLELPAHRITEIIREVCPQVVVTYDETGLYGHPDHIRAHEAALAAVEAATDPSVLPEAGPPHEVSKLYYVAVPRSSMELGRALATQLGATSSDDFFSEEEIENIATDDELITTAIDVEEFVGRKFHALEAHRTQLGTTQRFLEIPQEFRSLALGTEHYVLARSHIPHRGDIERDLFEGLTT